MSTFKRLCTFISLALLTNHNANTFLVQANSHNGHHLGNLDLSPSSPPSSLLNEAADNAHAYLNKHTGTDDGASSKSVHCACDVLREMMKKEGEIVEKGKGNEGALYTSATQSFWSATTWLQPGCVFLPKKAGDVAVGLRVLKECGTKFAVKGGGHMPNPGSSSIGPEGVLVSLEHLNDVELSTDKSAVSVGAGSRWGKVYQVVEKHGLTVVGARANNVGVSGFLLGGGLSWLDTLYGLGADNVEEFEVVLADSSIVLATSTNTHKDLFWALKGGSSNFGIVTRFTIKPHNHGPLAFQGTVFSSAAKDKQSGKRNDLTKYLDALQSFQDAGDSHTGSALTPVLLHSPAFGGDVVFTNLYNVLSSQEIKQAQTDMKKHKKGSSDSIEADNEATSTIARKYASKSLKPFFSLPGTIHSIADVAHHSKLAAETAENNPNGLRQFFLTISTKATREALEVLAEGFYDAIGSLVDEVPDVQVVALSIQPISKSMIRFGNANSGGNCLGLVEDDGPMYWANNIVSYTSPTSDKKVTAWSTQTFAKITKTLQEKSLHHPYLYLNDAAHFQPVLSSYSKPSLERLLQIKSRYDPHQLWTLNLKGGFKLPGKLQDDGDDEQMRTDL